MTTSGPVVVATAMALDASARARLSELLGPGFLVVDIRSAPATSNIVIAPHVSDMALSHLRVMFPQARILFSELFDPTMGIDYRGPVYAALSSEADGYLVTPTLDALSHEVTNQAALQLTGSRTRTPLQLPHTSSPDIDPPTPAFVPDHSPAPTIWWINGPFGVGKTTLATALARTAHVHVFAPDEVGFMLRRVIHEPVDDVQSWPAWRALVAETAIQLVEHHGTDLVCPMSLLDHAWAREIFLGIELAGIRQRHVVLHADPEVLRHRITHDEAEPGAVDRRLEAMPRYDAARSWLTQEAEQVDTTNLDPDEVLHAVATLINAT